MTIDDAAALLLRTLLREDVGPEVRSLVLTGLEPGDMFLVEFMMILDVAQRIHKQGGAIALEPIEAELAPEDPAGFARLMLRQIHEDRHWGPTELDEVMELVEYVAGFRATVESSGWERRSGIDHLLGWIRDFWQGDRRT